MNVSISVLSAGCRARIRKGDEMTADTTALYDAERLTQWLDEHIPEMGDGPLEVGFLHGGTSNVILTLNRGGETLVLRRPPVVPPPGSEKTVLREARILTALNGTSVPHPVCRGSCADPGVIGAPFYIMDKVDGWAAKIIDERIYHKAPFDKAPYEYGIAYAMVDGLVALANVDYKAVGLEGFGKPDNFLERQVDRWEGQLRSYKELYNYEGRELPGYELTRDWLRANIPSSFKAGIIHGDYGTPNALFADGPPARLTAIIDWELSTIGDPLMDLAAFTNSMRDEAEPDVIPPTALYASENWPTRQEMARYYAAGTGRDLTDFDYFAILTLFKGACILEYKVAQAAAGILSKETGIFFSRLVLENFAAAEKLIRRIG
jgi:aminoglycoside phosphotransferase (APT) family kinase protein